MIYVKEDRKTIAGEHDYGTKFFVYPRREDAQTLYEHVKSLGINKPIKPDHYHVTVIYSEHQCPEAEYHDMYLPLVGRITGWHIFESPLGRCLVAAVESEDIVGLNKELVEGYGATSKFPSFIAHMTVSWNHIGDAPEAIDMPILFDAYKCAGIDPLWSPATLKTD